MRFGWWSVFVEYIWPPSVIAKVLTLFSEWHRSDTKDKAILALFFVPALICAGGLIFHIASFMFQLVVFVVWTLGWLLLTSLFSSGGLYCYDKMNDKRSSASATRRSVSDFYDVTIDEEMKRDDMKKDKKTWFDDKKAWFDDIKWFRK